MIVIFFSLILVYEIGNFRLFDIQLIILQDLPVSNRQYRLRICYLPSNASSQSYIQVRKYTRDYEEIIDSFEKYNYLKNCYIEGDTAYLLVADTSNTRYEIELKKILIPVE